MAFYSKCLGYSGSFAETGPSVSVMTGTRDRRPPRPTKFRKSITPARPSSHEKLELAPPIEDSKNLALRVSHNTGAIIDLSQLTPKSLVCEGEEISKKRMYFKHTETRMIAYHCWSKIEKPFSLLTALCFSSMHRTLLLQTIHLRSSRSTGDQK